MTALWHIGLVLATGTLTLLSGLLLQLNLTSPDGLLFTRHSAATTLSLHGLLCALLTTLPVLILLGGAVALPRWRGVAPRIAWLSNTTVAVHALAVVALPIGVLTSSMLSGPSAALPLTLALLFTVLAVLLMGAQLVRGLAVVPAWRRSPLAWGVFAGALVTLVLIGPAAVALVVALLPGQALDAYFGASVVWTQVEELGAPIAVGIAALGWAVELVLVHGGARRVLGVTLLVCVVTYGVVAPRVPGDLHVADSTVMVALIHLLHGAAVVLPGLALLAPRRGTRASLVRVTLTALCWLAMCAFEALLGMQGMARRYAEYDPVFTTLQQLVGLAALAFVVTAGLTLLGWWREPRLPAVDQTFD